MEKQNPEMIPVPGLENDPQLSNRIYPLATFEFNTHCFAVRAIDPAKIRLAGNQRTGIIIAKVASQKTDGAPIFAVRNVIDGSALQSPQITSKPHEALRIAAWMKTQFRNHKIYAASPEVSQALKNAGVDALAVEAPKKEPKKA